MRLAEVRVDQARAVLSGQAPGRMSGDSSAGQRQEDETIRDVVNWSKLSELAFSYAEQGATASDELPAGYHHIRRREPIGHGRAKFEAAACEVMRFGMQRGAGVRVQASTPVAQPDAVVVVGAGPVSGACRVVYVVDEPNRRGFAYGTLSGHPESGEEYFGVSYDPSSETVYADVKGFSRPGRWWTKAGSWVASAVQRTITDRYLAALKSDSRG